MMRAIPFTSAADTGDRLRVVNDWPKPQLTADEVLISVKAFGLNFADILARKGQYKDAPPFPFVPGYEVAGVVEAVGEDVKEKFNVGDKVMAFTSFAGYAEFAVAKAQGTVHMLEDMTFAQAASIPVNFGTAFHSLYNTGVLFPGSRVLIHACAGGVGLAAVQLALQSGCIVYGTCGSDAKVALLRDQYGVQYPINYRTTDFEAEVMRLTNGQGVDVIIDSVTGSYIKKDLNILRGGGRVVGIGGAFTQETGIWSKLGLIPQVLSMITLSGIDMMMNSKSFCGVNMKKLGDHRPDILEHVLGAVMAMFKEGKLKTCVTKEFSWHKIAEAHKLIESRGSTGKIVLLVD